MSSHSGKIGRKAEVLIAAMLVSPTLREAALASGVSLATAVRWQKDPEFQDRFQKARAALVQQATTVLRSHMAKASRTLAAIAENPDVAPGIRVMASSRILEFGLRAHEIEVIETRIAALEAAEKG